MKETSEMLDGAYERLLVSTWQCPRLDSFAGNMSQAEEAPADLPGDLGSSPIPSVCTNRTNPGRQAAFRQ
jgi:hypothetical protein